MVKKTIYGKNDIRVVKQMEHSSSSSSSSSSSKGTSVTALRDTDFGRKKCDGDDASWIVDFYAPWCPHCRKFAPVYESDAEWFMSTYPSNNIRFGILNCDRFGVLCRSFNVSSYPTLRYFPSLCSSQSQLNEYRESRSNRDRMRRWYAERAGVVYSESVAIISNIVRSSSVVASVVPQVVVSRQDIAAAVFFSLKHNIFNGVEVLSSKDSSVLKSWLLLLERNLDDISTSESIASLRRTFFEFENLDFTFWNRIVTRTYIYGFDSKISWTSTCAGLGHGYPCALWQLFHFLALHSGDSGLETLLTIRNFVDRFFRCDTCQQHFRDTSSCLLDKDMPCGIETSVFDARAASLWLWSAHNNVTARISSETHQIKPLYPSSSSCRACWDPETNSWNENSVYAFLRTVYATPTSSSPNTLSSEIVMERENFEYAVVSLVVVILALSAIVYATCKIFNEAKTLSRKHRFRRIQEATSSSGTRNASLLLSRRNLINNSYTSGEIYSHHHHDGEEEGEEEEENGTAFMSGVGSRFLVHRVTSTV